MAVDINRTSQLAIKRSLDVVGSLLVMLALSPLMGGVAIAILLRMGRPVLFRQVRPGYRCETFELLKFRTMTNARDAEGQLLPDEERLTRLGGLLRHTSLDELPQLWNVFRGDMSLVGPRPLLAEYLELYSPRQLRRHEMRPGITGLAQTEGRNELDFEERFEVDVRYVENWSLALDLNILWHTMRKVLAREGTREVERWDQQLARRDAGLPASDPSMPGTQSR